MTRSSLTKKLLKFGVLFLVCSPVFAFDWQPDNHQVLTGDINGDTVSDVYLQPLSAIESVNIPYGITLNLETLPKLGETILRSSVSGFGLNYSENSSDAASPVWEDTNRYSRHFGDFNGDGYQDVLLQANQATSANFIILGFEASSQPSLWRTLSIDSIGLDLNSTTTQLLIEDVNNDGLDDIVIQQTGQGGQVLLSQEEVEFNPLLAYPFCAASNGLIDSDCDNVADRYDAEKYNAQESTTLDSTLSAEVTRALNGNFDVSASGKSSYTVGLSLPPSVANIAPSLSLNYSQQAGNGIVGMGWFINGLSEINRCPTTIAQDGYINGVNFNSADRYCLNGQRLIAVGPNEYRTENETFAKIISSGSAGNGPASFTVIHASGDTEYYGTTANSQRLGQDGSDVHTWAISRLEDREGNQASYTYINNRVAGQFWISRIDFNANANAGQAHNSVVQFEYENRSDVTPAYTHSLLTVTDQRLKYIRTFVNDSQVRYYQLDYTAGRSQRSLVASVKECLASGECLPQTNFSWDKGLEAESELNLSEDASHPGFPADNFTNQRYQLGDVNGDGKSDVVWTYRDNNVLGRVVFLANAAGDGFVRQATELENGFFAGVVDDNSQQYLLGDINGDGKSDLVWVARHINTVVRNVYLANESGTGFINQGYEVDTNPRYAEFLQGRYRLADVNGDNLQDLVWIYHHNNRVGINTYLAQYNAANIYLGKVSEFIDTDFSPDFYQNQEYAVGDVNGDSKSDVVWTFSYQNQFYRLLYLANASGSGFTKISLGADDFLLTSSDHSVQLGDINGDRKADLVWTYNNGNQLTRTVYLASRLGTSFNKKTTQTDTNLSLSNHRFQQSRLSDINGDGRQDLIYTYTDNATFGWVTYLSTMNGEGFTRQSTGSKALSAGTFNHEYRFADMSGDGKPDLIWTYNTATGILRRQTFTQVQSYPDHIETITDGLNNTIAIDYDYLINSSVYTPGEPVSYPIRNDTSLSYVVTKVTRSNGIGGHNVWDYRYQGARTHLQGRGFLGFEQRTIVDRQRQFTTTEVYRQEFPFIGDKVTATISNPDYVINETHNDWQQVLLNNGTTRYRYLDKQAVITRNINNGIEASVSILRNTYDNTYGQLIRSVTQTGRGYSNFSLSQPEQTITSDYSYAINSNTWRIRFVDEETKTYVVPGETTRSVTRQLVPYNEHSLLPLSETHWVGTNVEYTHRYQRDGFGNILSISTSAGDIDHTQATTQVETVNRYIDGLYAEVSTNAEGHTERRIFDKRYGTVLRHTDANGLISDSLYDGFGHLLLSRSPDGSETLSDYEFCGSTCPSEALHASHFKSKTVTHKQAIGQLGIPTVVTYYDSFHRVVATKTTHDDGRDNWVQMRYDNLGRVDKESQPYLASQTAYWKDYNHDTLDRVIFESRPDGGRTTTQYLSNANYANHTRITSHVNVPNGDNKNLVVNLYQNSFAQLLRSEDANGVSTHFDYDAQGHLRETIVNNNDATRITITTDVANNRTRLSDPNIGDVQYEFDGFMRERRRTHGGQITTSHYDRLNRLVRRTDNDGSTTDTATWSHDPVGALGQMSQARATDYEKNYQYDSLTRLQRTETRLLNEASPKVSVYRYDPFSRDLSMVYPSGLGVSYVYNSFGYQQEARNADTNVLYWEVLARNAYGEVTAERFGNGATTTRDYELAMGRIERINTQAANSDNDYQQLSYLHDSAGNLIQRSSSRNAQESLSEVFNYDNLHRLTSADTTGLNSGVRQLAYSYDPLGNITTKSDVSDTNGYRYGENNAGANAVSSIAYQGNTTQYTYDNKGNMITRGDQSLVYSVFNKPTAISESGISTTFQYGPERQRFYQETNNQGVATRTWYYGPNFEVAEQGSKRRERVTIGNYLVISRVSDNSSNNIAQDLDYLHRDHLGNVEATSDRFGHFTGRLAYDPWGQRRQDNWENASEGYEASLDQRNFESTTRGFTNHEHLNATGLIHMNGRVYDPIIGRFLSPDDYIQFPESSQSYNRYTYVLNNPLSYTDPSGEIVITATIATVWAVTWAAVKVYDIASTAYEASQIITDDSLSTGEKSLEIAKQVAMAAIPVPKVVTKTVGRIVGGRKAQPKPVTNNKQAGNKKSQEGSGNDRNTEKRAESKGDCGGPCKNGNVAKGKGPDFIVGSDGATIVTSQSRMRKGFKDAGFDSQDINNGMSHIVPTPKGNVQVRTMEGGLRNARTGEVSKRRAVLTTPGTKSARLPGGGTPQGTKLQHREASHFDQTP